MQQPKPETSKKRGWDEIESLFDDKKKKEKEQAATAAKEEGLRKARRKQHKAAQSAAEPPEKRATAAKVEGSEVAGWVNDGLGGKFNTEGFTGRVEDGVKIFKAHVLSKPNAGQTADCPFDCDCCYI